jgi:uncharacterized protein (TIGR02145 family)
MKKVLNYLSAALFIFVFVAFYGCKKDPEMPVLTTTAVTSITTSTASTGGNITDDGGAEVTARGVCWGTATNPTISGSKTNDGTGIGNFTSDISGLSPNTLYYVRAYATNSAGTAYGNELSFTTEQIVGATLTTTAVTSITSTTAVSGGNITDDGGADITARGVCWAETANPTTADSKTENGTGTGSFSSNLTGLTPGTLYHVRAYATNSSGTVYGSDVTFTTLAEAPTVTTAAVTVFTQTTATAGGNVTDDGGADVTERGVWFGTAADPVTSGGTKVNASAAGSGAFTVNLTGLTSGTLYHVVAFATNSAGTSYGTEVTFTTSAVILASVTTATPAFVVSSSTSIAAGGNVTSNGGGTVTERGVCYSTSPSPDDQDDTEAAAAGGTGEFNVTLTGLSEGTVYYLRAYAANDAGVAYGQEVEILTRMSDADDNIYSTIEIGTQIWMAENLKTTVYRDGVTDIPLEPDNGDWILLNTPAYCWYNNTEGTSLGALYNWFAASNANLCPTGWHVPSTDEFKILEDELGMSDAVIDDYGWRGTTEGSQMKSTTGWNDDGNGTNTSGFTALPAGYRYYQDGTFQGSGTTAYFWTRTELDAPRGWHRLLLNTNDDINNGAANKQAGKSIRCLKD